MTNNENEKMSFYDRFTKVFGPLPDEWDVWKPFKPLTEKDLDISQLEKDANDLINEVRRKRRGKPH